MRYLFFILVLFTWCSGWSQGSGFSFSYTGPTQIIVGPSCEAALQWGHPNTPTASSNIPGGVIVSFNIYSISLGYQIGDLVPGGTTVTVFYQAVDNFGNNALFGFTIAFIDVLPPVFDPFSLPQNITVACQTNVPPPAMVEASDNCNNDNVLTITYTQTTNSQLCTGGTIIRKWVADDDLGNQSTYIQTITVLPDNTPPVITNNLQNGMAPCSTAMAQYATWLTAQRAAFTATDNGCGIMSLTDNAPAPAIITSFCGVIDVTFTAKDNCNNTSTVVKTFTVFNNVAPIITSPASDANGNCSQNNIAQIFNTWINTHGGASATDDCSSIFWTTLPPAPSIQDTCDAAIVVIFIAGDGCGNYDTTSASFILTDDTGPTFTTDPATMVLSCSTTGLDSTLMDWLVTGGHSAAHDLCTSDDELVLGYQIGGNELSLQEVLDAWQDSLSSGCKDNVIIGGIGINNVKAFIPVTFTYTDKCDNESGKNGFFGITDNGRPQFLTMPVDTSFACSKNDNWENAFLGWYNTAGGSTFTDLCGAVSVQTNISADSAMQYLAAALDTACLQGVAVTIQFGLTDECGNTSLTSPAGAFSLQDTTAPVLISPALDFNASCSGDADLQLHNWLDTLGGAEATDGCGDLTWEFSWVDTAGMTQTGTPGSGPYPPSTNLDCSTGFEVIFTAFDICQNSVSDTALFSIIDTLPPMIQIEEDSIHLTCQDSLSFIPLIATDDCDSNPSIFFMDSVSTDSCLGLPEWIIRTWTATDACGNIATATQWIFRLDTIPPTFELPLDTVAFCSVDTLTLVNVQDNCDPAPVTTFDDQLTGSVCNQTLTRTWTVTDGCGNFSTAVQQFDLSDDAPPVITYSPGDFIYTCDISSGDLQTTYEQWRDLVVVEDGCSDVNYFIALRDSYTIEDTVTWPGTPVPDSVMIMCGAEFLVEADLVAYDACGNIAIEQISFTVNDTVGPSFLNCPAVIIVIPDTSNCDGLVTLARPDFLEICFPNDVKIQLTINGGDTLEMDTILSIDTILPVGIHTVVWIATDCNGNIGTCSISVEIIDEEALAVSCPPDTLLFTTLVNCQEILKIVPPATVTSSCGLGVITWSGYVEGNANPSAFVFANAGDSVFVEFTAGVHQVFLIAQDSTGDSDTCNYIIELRDTFPPEILCQNGEILLHPSGLENIDLDSVLLLVSASDACGIDHVTYDPPSVNCTNSGQLLNVTITVFDENGNSSTCESMLSVNAQPLMPLWESQLCDDTLRLFANLPEGPDANYSFSWSGPNSFSSIDENPIIPDADTTFSGIYVLTVQSENGCVSTGSLEVLILNLNAPSISISDDTLCTGEEIIFTAPNYSGEVIYQWFHLLPIIDSLLGTTTVPEFTYIPLSPGTYSVYAVVIQDTCTSEPGLAVNFEVVSVPVASIPETSIILCSDDSLFLSPTTVIAGLHYVWTGPAGYEAFEPNPPGIPAGEIDSSATYILVVSNDHCSSEPVVLDVFVQPDPITPVIDGDAVACEGGIIHLTTQLGYQSYEWIDPTGTLILTDNDTLVISPAVMDHSGNWRVKGFINGCSSDTSEFFSVHIDTGLQIQIIAPQRVCEGSLITLSISPPVGGTYVWSGPGGFMSNEVSPTTTALAGTYSLALSSSTGCEAAASITIDVDLLPVITSLITDAGDCANGIDPITIWAETQPPFSSQFQYVWEGVPGFVIQDSSIIIDSASSAANGLYTLVIINGTCISQDAFISLDVNDSPSQPVISGENVYCFGDSIILNIESPLAGGIYSWTSQDTNAMIPSPGTLIVPNATPGWTGIYRVDVTVDGCTSSSSMIAVQVRAALFAPGILSPPLICEGDSLVLIAAGPPGATYHWLSSNGFESIETRPVIYPFLPQDAGTYQVYYELNGCLSPISNPYDIAVQPTVGAPVIEADLNAVCIDNPTAIQLCVDMASQVSGGLYTWMLNGSVIGIPGQDTCITISGNLLQEGLNTLTANTSLQGCPSETSNTVIIQGDQIPDQQADAGLDIEFCPGETITLNASSALPGSGLWTSNDDLVVFSNETDPNADIIGLPSGIYELIWTLSYASCNNYSSDEVVVSILTSPITLPDTVEVLFGQTSEFVVTLNDTLSPDAFTLQIVLAPQRGNALHAGNGIFRYSPNVGFVGTDMLIYRICSVECPDECSESVVILKVGNEDDCFIPTLFTPNEDGINDILIIPCLETQKFPNNKIMVFNEWGDAVFTASPYQNDWRGSIKGESLPVGTYFYIMDFGDDNTPKRSFLILER